MGVFGSKNSVFEKFEKMNILTKIRLINELNYKELRHGTNPENSWHMQYKDSAWIYAGNLSYKLTEGDILAVFSQYGEISNVNLVRDRETGTSKGFCFICYEDQRSTILAVDNFQRNGTLQPTGSGRPRRRIQSSENPRRHG